MAQFGNGGAVVNTCDCLRLVLPFPPSVNHSTRHANGVHYLSAEHKAFIRAVKTITQQVRAPVFNGRVRVEIVLYPENRRRWDLDNRIKATLDALQKAGVFADDEQVDELSVSRVQDTKRGEALVTIQGL